MGHGVGISPRGMAAGMGWGEEGRGYGVSPSQGCFCSAANLAQHRLEPGRVRMEMPVPNPVVTKEGHQRGHASTLLFWRSRMMCSKQLLLRKMAWRTGRSSQLSMAGMASTTRWR